MTRWIGWIALKGRKYIVLITTGIDTFSKLNLDQIHEEDQDHERYYDFPGQRGMHAFANIVKVTAARYAARNGNSDEQYGLPASGQ